MVVMVRVCSHIGHKMTHHSTRFEKLPTFEIILKKQWCVNALMLVIYYPDCLDCLMSQTSGLSDANEKLPAFNINDQFLF